MHRGGKSWGVVCAIVTSTLLGLIHVHPAAANITALGDINPPYDSSDPWILTQNLIVGATTNAGLAISDGSQVTSGDTRVGSEVGGNGVVQAMDAGSRWESLGMLYLGDQGEGTVTVSGGASLIAPGVLLGSEVGSLGYLNITGPGTTWQGGSTGEITTFEIFPADEGVLPETSILAAVGQHATGYVTISDGARVMADGGLLYLGYGSNGVGSLIVTGPGSIWEDTGTIRVGHYGTGSLMIQDGASVTTTGTAYIGHTSSTSRGNATVGDSGSLWRINGGLYVGGQGHGELFVSGGGRVISQTAFVGQDATGEGEVIVEGTGSLWENDTMMEVGGAGSARLQMSNGGRILTRDATVAVEPDSEGVVTVEGTDATLEVVEELILGSRGDASMTVSRGGQVETMLATMGSEAGSTATVTVEGAGSSWTGWGATYVGVRGRADLVVSGGASVWDQGILGVGTAAGGAGTVLVTGADSSVGGDALQIGLDGGRGSMTITNGGRAGGSEAWVGAGVGSLGEVLVNGPDSTWGATHDFMIGYYYGEGLLTVSNGAHASASQGFIGTGPGSTGTVIVTGTGSLLQTAHALYVGGDEEGSGGTGLLGIGNGGLVDGNEVTIWSTGVLMGEGTLRAGAVRNHGIICPGASIGTLTVDGDLSLESDSTLEVEIDNAGNSDKLIVTGAFSFETGCVSVVPTETIVGEQEYLVVEAYSVEWPTSGVGQLSTALLHAHLVPRLRLLTDPNGIELHVTAIAFDDASVARTENQRSLGSALNQIAEGGGNDLTMTLQQLPTADEVRRAYDQLSGQTTPSLAPVTVAGATRHVGMIAGRLRSAADWFSRDIGLGESSDRLVSGTDSVGIDAGQYLFAAGNGSPVLGDKPWGVWGRGYGLYGDRESESGVPGYQYTVYGAGFGVDYHFTDSLLLGLTGGYSDGDINYSGSRDSSDVAATHGGLYGGYEASLWHLDSILTYADLDYETRRFVDLTGERLEGDPQGDMLTGYLEAGLNLWRCGWTFIQPLAAFQYSTLHIDSFTETGGDSALTFDDERYESYKGSLGLKLTQLLFEHEDGSRAALELRGRWVHEFGDTQASFDAAFASDPGVVFRVSDEDISRDSAVLGAGLDTWFTRQTRLFLDYGTELNPDNTIHLVSAGLEHRW